MGAGRDASPGSGWRRSQEGGGVGGDGGKSRRGGELRKVGLGLDQDTGQPVAIPRIGARLASPKG